MPFRQVHRGEGVRSNLRKGRKNLSAFMSWCKQKRGEKKKTFIEWDGRKETGEGKVLRSQRKAAKSASSTPPRETQKRKRGGSRILNKTGPNPFL